VLRLLNSEHFQEIPSADQPAAGSSLMANLYLLYLAVFCRNITGTLTTPIVGVKRLIKTVVVLLRLLLDNAVITAIGVERHIHQNPTRISSIRTRVRAE
jgi:hypothetical protein